VGGVPEELWVEAEGTRVFVRASGEPNDRPLLCWHGVGLSSRGGLFLGEAATTLAVSHRLRVLTLDAPGFGRSPAIEAQRYRPQELVDLVPPLLEALGLDRAGFMGFSWGADLGCHLAARHPSALTALVLLDAGYSDPPLDPALTYEQRVAHYETETRGQPSEPSVSAAVVAAVEHGMAQAPPSLVRPQLANSRLPVLLIVATGADEHDLRRFAAEVPQAEIIRAEKAGHDVLAEGGQEIVDAIGAWLEEIDLP